jgi:hypothetical protein
MFNPLINEIIPPLVSNFTSLEEYTVLCIFKNLSGRLYDSSPSYAYDNHLNLLS